MQVVPGAVHEVLPGAEGSRVKWSPAGDDSPTWLLERWAKGGVFGTTLGWRAECLAIVERSEPDLVAPAQYAAKVIRRRAPLPWDDIWRAAPMLFYTLKEAQLWCEREVRLMEVGELM